MTKSKDKAEKPQKSPIAMPDFSALKLEIEYWPVSKLVEYGRNPRKNDHAVQAVADAIRRFGFRVPIIAKSDGLVIDGHLRLKAAKRLELETVPVVLGDDMTEEDIKAFRMSVNVMAEQAEWDDDLVRLELQDLIDLDYDISDIGFDDAYLDKLLTPAGAKGKTDPDDVPMPPKVPVTKPGDVWVLGAHRLMCGDSTNMEAVARLMNGMPADMLLTDPPYNVDYEGKTKKALKIKNDKFGDEQFRQFLRDAFVSAYAVMKPGAVFYIWHADSEGYNFRGACHDAELKVRQCLIWKKDVMVMGRQDYHWKHEPCLYGWKDGAAHLWASDRKQVTILEFDRPSRSEEHPTMKPVALFEYQMLNNTKGKDIVLDLFGGSGTTMIAAEKNGRRGFLMELDPIYCDVIIDRWQKFSGESAYREADDTYFNDLQPEGKAQ